MKPAENHYSLDENTREWHSYDEKSISNNRGDNSDVWDGGATSEYFLGKVGPKVDPSIPNHTVLKIDQPATPEIPEVKLDSFKVSIKENQLHANWIVNETSSPQFKAQLLIKNGNEIKQSFAPVEAYTYNFSTKIADFDRAAGDVICLSITDVYNETTEFTYTDSLDVDFNVNENNIENIRLLGIFDQRASELELTPDGQVTYKKENINWPHNGKQGDYMGLTIQRGEQEIYKNILDAKHDETFSDTIQLEKGDVIDIYHEDPDKLFSVNKSLVDNTNKHNLIVYTGEGYTNPTNGESNDDDNNSNDDNKNSNKPESNHAAYSVFFQGYDDVEFANFVHDVDKEQGTLNILATGMAPHNNFGEEYASITIKDDQGKQTFNQSFIGTKKQKKATEKMTIKEGYTITLSHLEANAVSMDSRLQILDVKNGVQLDRDKTVTYRVKNSVWEKEDTQNDYKVLFQGYDDIEFANFTYNMSEEQGTLNILDIGMAPHNNFGENYASIIVNNTQGKQTFKKSFEGTQQQKASTEEITIKEGYTITFTHLEPHAGNKNDRLQIWDVKKENKLETEKTVTYQVTADGWEKI